MTRRISALAAVVACAGVFAGSVAAGSATAGTAHSATPTQLCAKVSASAVSSIVGFKVPAGVGETISKKATKANDNVAFSTLYCSFGAQTSIASLKKSVSVSIETLSRPLTAAELKALLQKVDKLVALHLKIVAYPSLGSEAYLLTFTEGGLTVSSLVMESGTKVYGATAQNSALISKLPSLLKLAQQL